MKRINKYGGLKAATILEVATMAKERSSWQEVKAARSNETRIAPWIQKDVHALVLLFCKASGKTIDEVYTEGARLYLASHVDAMETMLQNMKQQVEKVAAKK